MTTEIEGRSGVVKKPGTRRSTAIASRLAMLLLTVFVGGPQGMAEPVSGAGPATAAEAISQGQRHLGEGKLQEAVAAFSTAIAQDPQAVPALVGLGAAFYKLGRLSEAVDQLRRAVERQPDNAHAHFLLGASLAGLKDRPGSVAALRRCLELDASNRQASYLLGLAYVADGNHAGAVTVYLDAIRQSGKDANLYYLLGNAYTQIGRTDEAIAAYGDALNINPKMAQAANNLANLQFEKGNYGEARKNYELAIVEIQEKASRGEAPEPKYGLIYYNLGASRQKLGKTEEALESYRAAIRMDPALEAAYAGLWGILGQRGALEEARTTFSQIAAAQPRSSVASYYLGKALTEQGDFAAARTALSQALSLDAGLGRAQFALGHLLAREGDAAGALAQYAAALKVAPKSADPETFANLGRLHLEQGDTDAALGYANKLIEAGEDAEGKMLAARALYLEGKHKDAAQKVQQVLSAQPRHPRASFDLGVMRYADGDVAAAEALFKDAAENGGKKLAYYNLALVQHRRGEDKEALATISRAKAADVGSDVSRSAHDEVQARVSALEGDILRGLGRSEEALAAYEGGADHVAASWAQRYFNNLAILRREVGNSAGSSQALEKGQTVARDSAVLEYNFGVLALEGGDKVAARRHLERALELDSENGAARANLALLEYELGRYRSAAEGFEAALKAMPGRATAEQLDQVRLNLAAALVRAGEGAAAQAALQTVSAAKREQGEAVAQSAGLATGQGLLAQKRYSAAVTAYQEVIKSGAASADAFNNLGVALYHAGRTAEAATALAEAARRDTTSPAIANNAAVAAFSGGQRDQAMAQLERLLRATPDFAPAVLNLAICRDRVQGDEKAALELFDKYVSLRGAMAQRAAEWRKSKATMLGLELQNPHGLLRDGRVTPVESLAAAPSPPESTAAGTDDFAVGFCWLDGPFRDAAEALMVADALASYVRDHVAVDRSLKLNVYSRHQDIEDPAAIGSAALLFVDPVLLIANRSRHDLRPVAISRDPNEREGRRFAVVVPGSSEAKTLLDLRGQSLIVTNVSPSYKDFVARWLFAGEVPSDGFFGPLVAIDSPSNALLALRLNKAAAALVPVDHPLLRMFVEEGKARIASVSRGYPGLAVAVRGGSMDNLQLAKLAVTLEGMAGDERGKQILAALGVASWQTRDISSPLAEIDRYLTAEVSELFPRPFEMAVSDTAAAGPAQGREVESLGWRYDDVPLVYGLVPGRP
ncbi:MAG: tetratricopeptide repeat protein [Candidatus Schekmanbacteria bacterium]|nr:tetratricopeptide repeat protein [Candidatus Schekmanbacteria bacterium]